MENPPEEVDVRDEKYFITLEAPAYTKYSVQFLYDLNNTDSCEITTDQRGR